MSTLHRLIQDNNGYWYCIPVKYVDTFNTMMCCEWDEISKAGYEFLDLHRVDGPHAVEFHWPAKPDVVHKIVDILNDEPEWDAETVDNIATILDENGYKIYELNESPDNHVNVTGAGS